MHFIELKLCEKVGNILEKCNEEYDDSVRLCLQWLGSDVFKQIIDGDVVMCSQAKSYVARCFLQEAKNIQYVSSSKCLFKNDVLYWAGYLFTYWCLEYCEMPQNILNNYDIERILVSYETLHMLSIKRTICIIREEYCRG